MIFNDPFLQSLIIGLLATVVLIIVFQQLGFYSGAIGRRSASIFALLAGFLTFYYLRSNPGLLNSVTREIVLAIVGILLAFLYFLRRRL